MTTDAAAMTPRTDAFELQCRKAYYPHAFGMPYTEALQLARQLERENNRLRAEAAPGAPAGGIDAERVESVVACLGDDAAELRHSHEEVAKNCDDAAEIIEALAALVRQMAGDAERYRWHVSMHEGKRGIWCGATMFTSDDEVDAAIDAAREKK